MKVVIFSNIPAPYFVEYLNELGKQAEVEACFERANASDRDGSWKKVNAKNFNYHIFKGIRVGAENALSFQIIKEVIRNKTNLLIFANPTTPTGIIGTSLCRLLRIPFVIQSEGGLPKNGVGLKERIKKHVLSGAGLYLSGMKPDNDYFIAYGAPRQKVKRYNFASFHDSDMPTSLPAVDEKQRIKCKLGVPYKKIIMYVGRMLPVKGVDVLLRAFANINDEAGLLLVGGKCNEEYKQIIEENAISGYRFIPHLQTEELKEYYQIADVFVLPSRSDTWGLVINEAMTYGLPIVTTKNCVAGLELVADGKNGFLVDSEDYKTMSERIKQLLDDPSMCKQFGSRNYELIKGYTYETMAKQIFDYISDFWGKRNCK